MPENMTVLVGNLAADPELRYTPKGVPVAQIRLAVNERVRTATGWENGDTSFFNVLVWRDLAEHVAESLHKGDRTIVAGRWRTRSYDTPQGEKRTVTELHADEVGPSLRWVTTPQLVNPRQQTATAQPDGSPFDRSRDEAGRELRPAGRGRTL